MMLNKRIVLVAAMAAALAPALVAAQGPARPWTPVTSIDFSARKDILIQNFDGSFSAGDAVHYQSRKIAPGTWQIMGSGDYCYLVEGDREAIMIDGGNGAGSPRAYAQTLTKKPIRYIANTHSHADHVSNNAYFDKAFMSQGTKDGVMALAATAQGVTFPRDYPIEVIEEGRVFDLGGGRKLEAIMLGNHVNGSTAYLDRKERILFGGDDIMGQQGVSIRVSVVKFEEIMAKLMAHRGEFDTVAAGWEIVDASWVDRYWALAKMILAGNLGIPAYLAPPAPFPNTWRGDVPADPEGKGRTMAIRHNVGTGQIVPPGMTLGLGQYTAASPTPNPNIMRLTFAGANVTFDRTKIRD